MLEKIMNISPSSRRDVWLIPKRSSVHQIIGMVELLHDPTFNHKVWNRTKQEALGTKLGMRKLTQSGRAISGQSVRTLLANGPKYLGFVYIQPDTGKLVVSKAGEQLIKENLLSSTSPKAGLRDWEEANPIVDSPTFRLQLAKLILNNPLLDTDSRDLLVFPFRATLRLALELEYLDFEEIGYILFSMKNEDEYPLIKQRILNFRALEPRQRDLEIEAYKATEAGQLTLKLAPSANYYIGFCVASGLFRRIKVDTNKSRQQIGAITVSHPDEAKKLLQYFNDSQIYNFAKNEKLWIEYYTDPSRLNPPKNVTISFQGISKDSILMAEILKDQLPIEAQILDAEKKDLSLPMFAGEKYQLKIYDAETNIIQDESVETNESDSIEIKTASTGESTVKKHSIDRLDQLIKELAYQAPFDSEYTARLNLLKAVLGKDYGSAVYRGGRLEYLFAQLFQVLEDEEKIDNYTWYGRIGKYGLALPAPGGSLGNPDLVINIDDITIVLELTTIRANSGQWTGSEAASVPDHILRYERENGQKEHIIGIFCAPSINDRVESNFRAHSHQKKRAIICLNVTEFLDILINNSREEIKNLLKQTEQAIIS